MRLRSVPSVFGLSEELMFLLADELSEVYDQACEPTTSRTCDTKDRGCRKPLSNRIHNTTELCWDQQTQIVSTRMHS